MNVNRYNSSSDLHVRAVAASSHSDIVLDSGSDVTLLPIAMAGIGSPATLTPGTFLRDAQSKQILTSDVRDVTFIFQTTDGQSLRVKEKAFFSDKVDVPLLSFGKLIRAGWVSNHLELTVLQFWHIPVDLAWNSVSGTIHLLSQVTFEWCSQ